eukprot:SAG11_NODE_8492_length_1009_cov_1.520879_3_plen_89_part_01
MPLLPASRCAAVLSSFPGGFTSFDDFVALCEAPPPPPLPPPQVSASSSASSRVSNTVSGVHPHQPSCSLAGSANRRTASAAGWRRRRVS